LAFVIGGTSADQFGSSEKASAGYFDHLPTTGNMAGQAFRDLEWEKRVQLICQESAMSTVWGKYFTHDVRVICLRHAACPVGLGVSCSADRNIKGKITKEVFCGNEVNQGVCCLLLRHIRACCRNDLNQPMAIFLKVITISN
jgi:fumarate hydratase class I